MNIIYTPEPESTNSVSTKTTETEHDHSGKDSPSCTYWVRDDGREFLTDPNGEIVNLARLTAYAEYGDEIHNAHAHHELPRLKIDAPAFITPLTPEEHSRLHGEDPDPVEVEGIPRLRPEE